MKRGLAFSVLAMLAFATPAPSARAADPPPAREQRDRMPATPVVLERTRVRYYAPETGGPQKPRFITERMLGFMARLEAMMEKSADVTNERFVRTASDRFVAEDMLAELMIRGGTEPDNLPRLVDAARQDLCDRIGGCSELDHALAKEGIQEAELTVLLRRRIRAAYYLDRAVAPVLHPAEDEIYEAYRTALHPFRGESYDACKAQLSRWLTYEKLRLAELEYLQSARARVRIVALGLPSPPP